MIQIQKEQNLKRTILIEMKILLKSIFILKIFILM